MGAEAAISMVVKLLGDLLIQKVNFIQGVEDQVQLLRDEMNTMQSFLRDANRKQPGDERVRNWISEIREVALDAEDTIEMFTLYLDTAKSRGLLQSCSCFPSHVRHLNRIGKEIQSIRARLAEIDKKRERYGIKNLRESGGQPESSEVEVRRRLDPWRKEKHLVGVEDDVKKLLDPIMDEEKKGLSVAAIVGMGGIGKSTLAREVYNHPDIVSSRFHCRAWVVVSSEFTMLETIKELILETTEQGKEKLLDEFKKLEDSMRNRPYLEEKFKQMLERQLQGKTYFIVLDDVWEMKDFVSLKTIFPDEQDKTSRLLFTTRNKDIAKQCQILHEMQFLDSEKSWELFLKMGLGNINKEFPNELEHIGRQIVEKCRGLPLAITVMGGLLAKIRSNMDEWQEALNQLDSHLVTAGSSISAILELSYQNLSPQLKSCFLCLAFFKEDAIIPVKRLVNIIVGQGLIQHTRKATVEEIARGYIDELISRNVVQVEDFTFDNRVKSCRLHDSLRNICLKKAKEEIGLDNLIGDRTISLHKPRHRVVLCNDLGTFPLNQNKHIRSLFLLDMKQGFGEMKSNYWKSFQHLQNLDLDGHFDSRLRLPHSFQLLRGLKQLKIHRSYGEIELPTWLNTLKKLEILDLPTRLIKFPNVALEMNSLRHICGRRISGLITYNWKNVETLKDISKEDWMRSSLRMKDAICHIRELGMSLSDVDSLVENGESISLRASLQKLENLVKLYLYWGRLRVDVIVIVPDLRSLTKLRLWGKMIGKCPSASMLPPNLSHLTLGYSKLEEDPMQELGRLPKLLSLKLKWKSYKGERMHVLQDGFPSLRGLFLQDLLNLISVDIEEGGMPHLKLLQVDRCRSLDTKNLANKSYQLQIRMT